jgi:hypothetical protein
MLNLGLSLSLKNGITSSGAPPLPEYQPWESYPDSPFKTVDYPYQYILVYPPQPDYVRLIGSSMKLYKNSGSIATGIGANIIMYSGASFVTKEFELSNYQFENINAYVTPKEANNDIYTDSTLTVVEFAKTT